MVHLCRTTPLFSIAAALLIAPGASAVNIDWVTVGAPGNACDVQSQGCFGSVAEVYRISADSPKKRSFEVREPRVMTNPRGNSG